MKCTLEFENHSLKCFEVRNYVLHFTEGYSKVALCRQTYIANAVVTTPHTTLTVARYHSERCRLQRLVAPFYICSHVIVHPNTWFGGIAKKYDLVG